MHVIVNSGNDRNFTDNNNFILYLDDSILLQIPRERQNNLDAYNNPRRTIRSNSVFFQQR